GLTPSEILKVDFFLRYLDSENEFDASGGPGGDAPDNLSSRKTLLIGSKGHIDLFDSVWRQNIGVSVATHDRTSESAWGESEFDSQMLKAEWQNDIYLDKAGILTAGLEFETEEGESDSFSKVSTDTISIFAQDQLRLSSACNVTLGTRLDSREDFDEEATYRIAPVYKIKRTGTRLKATYGTGFKTPSLYQLYAPATMWGPIGNEDLEPERIISWDAGFEQELLSNKMLVGITYFQNNYEDMIDFVVGYQNISEAETKGVELVSNMKISDSLSIAANYTYLETEDKDTGDNLIRRPKHSGSAGANWQWTKRGMININLIYVGERDDRYYDSSMFMSLDSELSDYTLVNIATSYAVNDHLEIFGRIDNLLDEDYEEVTGYGTPGLSGYAGIKASL
ncbi:TonB-dependent receptor plug domain-containing protein, partial [Verrucomicrobiota bacterium]